MLVAAGTVLTIDQATEALDNGAQLLVATGYSAAVVRWAAGHGAPIPSRREHAHRDSRWGWPTASTPSSSSRPRPREGRRTWRRWRASIPSVRFVPTGGIDSGNLDRYLALRNVLACGGSWMVNRRLLETGDLAAVTTLTLEASAVVRRARIDEVAG